MTHLKPHMATVVLYQGDDLDQLADLKRAVMVAERIADSKSGTERVGDDDSTVTDAQVAYDAFVDEAAERALTIELHSIGRRRFRDLLVENPPRKVDSEPDDQGKTRKVDHEDDRDYGVNAETFPLALLTYTDGDQRTIVAPEFSSQADCRAFLDDELSEGDFDQLWVAAYMLNRSASSDPKFGRYSTDNQTSDET